VQAISNGIYPAQDRSQVAMQRTELENMPHITNMVHTWTLLQTCSLTASGASLCAERNKKKKNWRAAFWHAQVRSAHAQDCRRIPECKGISRRLLECQKKLPQGLKLISQGQGQDFGGSQSDISIQLELNLPPSQLELNLPPSPIKAVGTFASNAVPRQETNLHSRRQTIHSRRY